MFVKQQKNQAQPPTTHSFALAPSRLRFICFHTKPTTVHSPAQTVIKRRFFPVCLLFFFVSKYLFPLAFMHIMHTCNTHSATSRRLLASHLLTLLMPPRLHTRMTKKYLSAEPNSVNHGTYHIVCVCAMQAASS